MFNIKPKIIIQGCLWIVLMVNFSGYALSEQAVSRQHQGKRVALVIGNSRYQHLNFLKNPARDADAIAQKLSQLGFTLVDIQGNKTKGAVKNLNQGQFLQAIRHFAKVARGKEIALLFYAGHGMQFAGKPALLPIDIPIDDLELAEKRAIFLEETLRKLDNKAELTVAIFDACREIPDMEQAISDNTRATGYSKNQYRGMQRLLSQSRNRLIAYSGASGELVKDGNGQHSPYTTLLLEQLDKNNSIEATFQQVAYDLGQQLSSQSPELLIQGVPPNRYFLKAPAVNSEPLYSPPVIPQKARLTIRSNVYGDEVWLNGENKGTTRLDLKLNAGIYDLVIKKAGYQDYQRELQLTAGQAQVVYGRLTPKLAETTPYQAPIQRQSNANQGKRISHYMVYNNGTVKDTKTGLIWKRCAEGLSGADCSIGKQRVYNFKKAQQHAKQVTFAGHSDWRVPTIKELNTLVYCSNGYQITYRDDGYNSNGINGDCRKGGKNNYQRPTINQQVFPNFCIYANINDWCAYWSSSSSSFLFPINAWATIFKDGSDSSHINQVIEYPIRLVRKQKGWSFF